MKFLCWTILIIQALGYKHFFDLTAGSLYKDGFGSTGIDGLEDGKFEGVNSYFSV